MSKLIITMGDPAGIGSEIINKALADKAFNQIDNLEIFGEADLLPNVKVPVRSFGVAPKDIKMGQVNAQCGHAAYVYLEAAIKECLAGRADGIVTAPLHKEALNLAGHKYPGHTEILAEKSGVQDFVMLLAWPKFAVSHITTHVPVRQAVDLITQEKILTITKITNQAMSKIHGSNTPIAVAALNPHGGENGLLGLEEIETIIPAVETLQAQGLNVKGPFPADTAFHRAWQGEFKAVIAMLHDHGHIAGKLVDFDLGVNCTLGLPFVRTSVGHGTGFDIAGKGLANPQSLISAIEMAFKLL